MNLSYGGSIGKGEKRFSFYFKCLVVYWSIVMVKVTVNWMGTSDPAKQIQRVEIQPGGTVRDALTAAGVPTENVSVNVNRVKASLDQEATHSDKITVSQSDLKGAAVIAFEDILNWGKNETTVANNVVQEALAEMTAEAAKSHKAIVKDLIAVMQDQAADVNAEVIRAEKALAAAKSAEAELAYASEELNKGNIFSLLGFANMKDQARYYCSRMGCAVPANNSPVWATSPQKAE